jgi:hypothetical protein
MRLSQQDRRPDSRKDGAVIEGSLPLLGLLRRTLPPESRNGDRGIVGNERSGSRRRVTSPNPLETSSQARVLGRKLAERGLRRRPRLHEEFNGIRLEDDPLP